MTTRRSSLLLAALALVPTAAEAQFIQPPAGPLPPGGTSLIGLTNDQPTSIKLARLAMLQSTGELVLPELPDPSDTPLPIPPGATLNMALTLPNSGAGSSGSFLLFYPTGLSAVRRVDVAQPDPRFPDLHAFPAFIHAGWGSYGISTLNGALKGEWRIANSSALPLTLGPGDSIAVFPPGASAAAAVKSLAGLVIPAGRSIIVDLPLAGLAAGPYDVAVTLADPVVGTVVRRAGVHTFDLDDTFGTIAPATLHLPGGTVVPAGGALPAYLRYSHPLPVDSPPLFGLLLGFAPGSIAVGPNPAIPLAADSLVLASVTGLGGLLPLNVGAMAQVAPGCLCSGMFFRSPNLSIVHPSATALHGAPLRIAAVLYVPGLGPTASQAMPLRFE